MESKVFAVGEILTAQDVNDHLVNHQPPGAPFDSGPIEIPNPGGWQNHIVNLHRVGLIAVLVLNLRIGSGGRTDGFVGVIPDTERPGHTPHEFNLRGAGAESHAVRVDADGNVNIQGSFTTSWVRGSTAWVVGT